MPQVSACELTRPAQTLPTHDFRCVSTDFTFSRSEHPMHEMKDTARATVRIGYDGRVHKTFRGHRARERFEHEVRVLRYLEDRGCSFVPRLLEIEPENLKIVTTNCGGRVDRLNEQRQTEIFAELEQYGIRHEDRDLRNITYRVADGRFCVIDFEFATILDDGTGRSISLKPSPDA
jgi:tRNA A-37 threonylcarbamoyl transferase component Bud32